MESADELDGIDFKPFFDMVVGVLFILLILIAAQLFFTRFQSEATPQERLEREWREEIAGFLDRFARRLHDKGIEAQLDRANAAVVMPLGEFANAADGGLPRIAAGKTPALGEVLAESLGCVTGPAPRSEGCAQFPLLILSRARLELRNGRVPDGPGLPQDRYGRLLESLFSASLLQASPELLRVSGSDGGIALEIASSVGTGPAVSAGPLSGDVVANFTFVPPPPGTTPVPAPADPANGKRP
jgi:hypothetical protein